MGAFVVRDARKRSPFWYAVYRDATGRRLEKSDQTHQQEQSARSRAHAGKSVERSAARTLTEARTRDLLSEVLQSINGEGLHVFTLVDWFDHFVKGKRKSSAVATSKRHEQMMREFVEFLGPRSKLNIAAITSRDIADFRDAREALGLAPSTLNVGLQAISAAFNAAFKQGHISVNPCLAIDPLRDKPQRKAVFAPAQVSALLKAATGDWKGLIFTAFYVGARLGDCVSLQWSMSISFRRSRRCASIKGRLTARSSAVHPALEDYLLSLPSATSDRRLCFLHWRSELLSLSQRFSRLMQRAHIEQHIIRERTKQGATSTHYRSTHCVIFRSLLANSGIAEETRMALTGHTTRQMHQRYTHRDLVLLRDAVAVLPRV